MSYSKESYFGFESINNYFNSTFSSGRVLLPYKGRSVPIFDETILSDT